MCAILALRKYACGQKAKFVVRTPGETDEVPTCGMHLARAVEEKLEAQDHTNMVVVRGVRR